MDSRPKILVVGSTNTDLVVGVAHIPAPGETILGGALQTVAGGKGANQAVAAARLGGAVTFVGRVGDDTFGQDARAALDAEGIDTCHLSVTPGVASGVALITVAEVSGENAIVVAPGANACLSPQDVEAAADAFEGVQAVVVSLEIPGDAAERAVALAAERRVPVVLNPAPARRLPPALLSGVTVLTPNETEAAHVLGRDGDDSDPQALAAELLAAGPDAVVVTLGAAGALVATPDGVERVPAFPVRAVDTVAAGDCFTAALAVEFGSGRSLRDAVRFAAAAAALSVTRRGAQPSLPRRAEVESLLRQG